jgi:hypothetical protein
MILARVEVARNIKSAMAQCPKCATPIAVDFGIYTCATCESVLFIDFSGNVQLDSEKNNELPAPTFVSAEPSINNYVAPSIPLEEMPPPNPEPPTQINISIEKPASADLSEIARFGNSEASLGKEGPYLYDVLIWNIDSKEVREELREALKDTRFAWDSDRIMNSITKGALRIPKVNAVKAAVLVNRIKNLPLGISWEQSMHTDSVV